MSNYIKPVIGAILILVILFLESILNSFAKLSGVDFTMILEQRPNMIVVVVSWLIITFIRRIKARVLAEYDINEVDNLHSRKMHTQLNILTRVAIFIIGATAVGIILLSFENIREIGIGIFASAGVAGIIIGLSAQKVVGALLAGIQIAITQPFRIEDAVIVEKEYGWIEEINLTYVVVRLWDKRRLVLPSTYFLEKPFQNWTRTSADIIGSVYLYTDYMVPFEELRKELDRLVLDHPLWDKQVKVLQVTDAKETTVEMRILVSAKSSPQAWDLRVDVREKMIEFIQKNYPKSLPRTRVVMESEDSL